MMKRWLPWLLKGGLSAGLVAWVLSKVDLAASWDKATSVDPWMLALAVALLLLQTGFGAVRWRMVLGALEARFTLLRSLAVYSIGIFFSQILPGAVGGDAVRMWFSRRHGLPLHAAINSVMLERAMTVYGLVALVCLSQPLLESRVPGLPGSWIFQLLLAICTLGIGLLAVMDRLPHSLHRWQIFRGLAKLAVDTRAFFFHPLWSLGTFAVAVVGHANLSLAVYVLAIGLGLEVRLLDCLVLVPPVILAMTLPISIAGWGVRETAMVTAFGFVGVAADSAVVLSVLFGLVTMVTASPGGLVFLLSGAAVAVDEMEAEVEAEVEAEDDRMEETANSDATDPETAARATN